MAPAQFPLFRLATLLARQLSKPAADKIKRLAVAHPMFRCWACAGAGRAHHVLQLRLRLWTLALRQPRTLPPLSEQAAVNSGADILGEVAVFGLGGLIIIFEVSRQAGKQDDKVLEDESRRLAVLLSLAELRRELAVQQQDIERLQTALRHLAPYHYPGAPRPSGSPSPPPTASPTPPTSTPPSPPTSERPAPPTSERPAPPTSERPAPPTSERPTPPKSERPSPPKSERLTTPTLECPPPPTLECPPPPISECPKPVKSE